MIAAAPARPPANSQGAKRKPSAAGATAAGRPVKRRASKACHCCRSRKVRCDVVERGTPCTNCRLDMVKCVVHDSKRPKKHHGNNDFLNHSPPSSNEDRDDFPSGLPFGEHSTNERLSAREGALDASAGKSHAGDPTHHVPHMLCEQLLLSDQPTH